MGSAALPLLPLTQLLMAVLLLLLRVQLQRQPQRLLLLHAPTLRTLATVPLWWLKACASSLVLIACRLALAATILLSAVLILRCTRGCLRPPRSKCNLLLDPPLLDPASILA